MEISINAFLHDYDEWWQQVTVLLFVDMNGQIVEFIKPYNRIAEL